MWIALLNPSRPVASIPNRIGESCEDTAVVEFQLGVSVVGGGAPYLAHQIKRVSGLVETALDVQVCPPLFPLHC